MLAVHNLGPEPCQVSVELDADTRAAGFVDDLLGGMDDAP